MPRHARRTCLLTLVLAGALALPAVPGRAETAPIRLPMEYEPASLDPHKLEGPEEARITFDLFEGLTTVSATDAVIPGVAESWEASADGLDWTFHLRRDAVWSDGTPLTAADFVYSFRRALDPATACPYTLALIPIRNAREISSGQEKDLTKLGVTALDPHTLRITLAQSTPWLPALLTEPASVPVPRQAIEKWGGKWTQPEHMVTNGAFTLKQWVPLSQIVIARNPRFHDAAAVKIDEVDRLLSDDARAALKRYTVGELDVVNLLGKDLSRIKRERPTELHSYPYLESDFLLINMKGPLGSDARIRQALSMVIDREVLESKIAQRDQIPAYGLVPPSMPGYAPQRPDWADRPIAERIATAKQLLAEAGAPTPLKIHLLSPKSDPYQLYTRAIFAMWHAALGVEAEEEAIEARVFFDRLNRHDFDVAYSAWTADYVHPWTFLSVFRVDAAELNFGEYDNPKFDALLDQARAAADPTESAALMQSAEQLLLADQALLPIDHNAAQMLVSPRLHGYENAPLGVHPSRFLSVAESD